MTKTERTNATRNVWFINKVVSDSHSESKVRGPVHGLTSAHFSPVWSYMVLLVLTGCLQKHLPLVLRSLYCYDEKNPNPVAGCLPL